MATKTLPKKSAPKSRTKKPDCPINNVQQYAEGTTPITDGDLAEMGHFRETIDPYDMVARIFSWLNTAQGSSYFDYLYFVCPKEKTYHRIAAITCVFGYLEAFSFDRVHSNDRRVQYQRTRLLNVEIFESYTLKDGSERKSRFCSIDSDGVITLN